MKPSVVSTPQDAPMELPAQDGREIELSVVMPCLNEAETLGSCIVQAQQALDRANVTGEVVVADNGSNDGSIDIAEKLGARVVSVERKGYGSALMGGIAAARGKYVVMGDSDASYDFSVIPLFLEKLRAGNELVMGNRFRGGVRPGAMPALHRYLGNPALTGIGRLFFNARVGDFHCGLRGFSKAAYTRMGLSTTGMEFASEMVVKATLLRMSVCEVATTLSRDGRSHPPHLRAWRDGWRHLRFLLLYSPRWLFLYPGMVLMLLGVGIWLLPGPRPGSEMAFEIHRLLYAATAVMTGFQAIAFAFFSKIFAITEGLLPEDPRLNRAFRVLNLEKGLASGALLIAVGLGLGVYSFVSWSRAGVGLLNPAHLVRVVAAAMVSVTLGVEIVLSSFFLSILGLARK
jgi:glycosyltransferase involved in cell wall biosynthesis